MNAAQIDEGDCCLALRELNADQSGVVSLCAKAGVRTDYRKIKKVIRRFAVSRFHDHPVVEVFAVANGIESRVLIGPALKSAAGQVVLQWAGG